jgi:hypothetical protein
VTPNARTTRTVAMVLSIVLVAVIGMPIASWAAQQFFALAPGDSLTVSCDTRLSGRVRGKQSVIECIPGAVGTQPTATQAVPTATALPPVATQALPTATALPPTAVVPTATPSGQQQPVAGQLCPDWVHDQYVATAPDGKAYRTWHPPTDARYGCWFGHEHGSDPSLLPNIGAVGMPVFGYTSAQIGLTEPHVGYKVYVVDDRDRGIWWMLTFHQGTSGAARAFARFHTLDIAVVRASDGAVIANTHLMGDTGNAVRKCDMHGPIIPGSGTQGEGGAVKVIPTSDCATDVYESWASFTHVGNLFTFQGALDIDNGATVLAAQPNGTYSTTDFIYTASLICPGIDPLKPGNDCDRFGDKRSINNPRMAFQNTSGSNILWTDVYGNLMASGQGIQQFVSTAYQANVQTGTNYVNGLAGGNRSIYTSVRFCNDSGDCNPRNFNDGTVRLPN